MSNTLKKISEEINSKKRRTSKIRGLIWNTSNIGFIVKEQKRE